MKTCLRQFNRTKGEATSIPWWCPVIIILLLWGHLASVALAQTKEWDQTYGGNNIDALAVLQQTSDGGYILGGSSFSGFSGDKTDGNKGQCDAAFCTNDYWLVKIDAAGNKQWDRTYGGDKTDILTALLQTQDEGYILGGYSNSGISGDKSQDSRGSYDYWVLKISGSLLPPQLISFSPTSGLPGAVITITGKNLLTTRAVRFSGLKSKIEVISDDVVKATVPVNAVSGKITVETAGGKVHNSPTFTVLAPEISAVVPFEGEVGSTVFLEGNRLSSAREVHFNGIKSPKIKVYFDFALTAIVPEGATSGKIKVVLKGGGNAISKSDFIITTLDPVTADSAGARQAMLATTLQRQLEAPRVTVFPNPFVQQVSIGFTVAQPQPVTVKVYDLLGREVSVLYQGEALAGEPYQVDWRPKAQLSGGLYIIRLESPGQNIHKRVVLRR